MLARLGPICEGDTWPQRQTHSEGECEARGRRPRSTNQGEATEEAKPADTRPGRLASETVRPSVSVIQDPPVCGSLLQQF